MQLTSLSLALSRIAGGGFSPLSLFAAGEQGAWYDPSDFQAGWRRNLLTYTEQFDNAAWTKAAATITSTSVVDPLGGSTAETIAIAAGGRVVQAVSGVIANTNYTFSAWVKKSSIGGGATAIRLTTTNTLAYNTGFSQKFTLTSEWVRISATGVITSGTSINNLFGSLDVAGNIDTDCIGNVDIWGAQLEVGSTATTYQRIVTPEITYVADVQPQPILYQDSAGTTPVTAVEQRVGLMLDKSGRGNHAFQATTTPNDKRPILSARVNLLLATSTLSTQSVTTQATSYTLYFTGTGLITLSGTATGTYSAGSNTITCTAGTLTLTVSGSVLTADLRPSNIGNNIPAYQRVNTATDYDTTGFPLYLKADGTYTSMSTNSINFSATDKMTVVSGVRKLSDAAQGVVSELSATSASNNGSFTLSAPGGAATNYTWLSKGTTADTVTATPYTSPISGVLTGLASISGPSNAIRVNGTATSDTNTQGTGNYGNYPLYLFARNNASLFLNGYCYGAIIRGATTSGTDLTNAESYMNTQSGGLY